MTNSTTATTATTTATSATAMHMQVLRFTRGATEALLKDFPESKYCEQPGPCVNHALWNLGHFASTDDYFAGKFGGTTSMLPPEWDKLFGMGSTPTSDASKYPSIAEVRKAMVTTRAAVEKWVSSLSAAQLSTATPEDWHAYAPTVGDLPPFLAWHEGYHQGQLSVLRRGLGLARAFG